MLTQMATPEMINKWKSTFAKYTLQLKPNKKDAEEVIQYLQRKYSLEEITTKDVKQVIIDTITMNKPFADKLPVGKELQPLAYIVLNENEATRLYAEQDELFMGMSIIAGIEFETAYVSVWGSGELADELVAFQGLDEVNLNNYYLVANYINCLKKHGMLDSVLSRTK